MCLHSIYNQPLIDYSNTLGVIKEIWFHRNTTTMKKEFLKTRETFKEYKLNNDRDGWTFKDQN